MKVLLFFITLFFGLSASGQDLDFPVKISDFSGNYEAFIDVNISDSIE